MKGLTLALFGLLSVAQAQIAFLPLDSRPTTRILPLMIAELSGKTVVTPPRELLGDAKQGANLEGLKSWLETQNDSEALYIALDALAYGGLVQSRSSTISAEEALKNLEPVRQYAQLGKPVYASITIPRFPDAKNRPRNLEVIHKMLEWAREGVFKELRVTWDDALGGSPAPLEGIEIAKIAPPNVRVYPGADEVLSSLFASSLAPAPKRLRVVYSDPSKVKNVLPYDGLSLEDSVKLHAESNGFKLFEVVPDLTLYVYNGGNSRKAVLNIKELARAGEVSVVDIAKVNVGTPAFWKDLRTLGVFHGLSSFAAWGTPGNNFGTALAQAKLWLEFGNLEANRNLLAYEYQNDLLYSSVVRFELRKVFPETALAETGPRSEAARDWLLRRSSRNAQLRFPNGEYVLGNIFLPWNRSFEAEGALELVPSGE